MPTVPTPINGFLDEFMRAKVVETGAQGQPNVWSRRSN
jgi:hypothetical protein